MKEHSQISEDSRLVKQALKGIPEAHTRLVQKHQQMVAGLIQKITRRPDMVEDLAQEVFIKAFQQLKNFRDQSNFSTWLYRIAVNTCLDTLRKEKSERKLFDDFTGPESFPDTLLISEPLSGERLILKKERQIEVKQALEKISLNSRIVLTLRYLKEFSTPEIAQILDLPEGTVRSRLHYARMELAEVLAPFMSEKQAPRAEERNDHVL